MNRTQLIGQRALGVPQVVVLLHAQPERGAVAGELADAQGHFRGEAFALGQQLVIAYDALEKRLNTEAAPELEALRKLADCAPS